MNGTHGGVSAELAILTPVLMLLCLFVVLTGRLGQAEHDVTQAAAEAARAASLVRIGDVAAVARATAARNLDAGGVRCQALNVATDLSDHRPGGSVAVGVSCDVDLHGVAGLGLPRGHVISSRAVEVIDTYRGDG